MKLQWIIGIIISMLIVAHVRMLAHDNVTFAPANSIAIIEQALHEPPEFSIAAPTLSLALKTRTKKHNENILISEQQAPAMAINDSVCTTDERYLPQPLRRETIMNGFHDVLKERAQSIKEKPVPIAEVKEVAPIETTGDDVSLQAAAIAMQLQASAKTMQAQASTLMMEAAHGPQQMQSYMSLSGLTHAGSRPGHIGQLMNNLRQLMFMGEYSRARLHYLIDLELEIIERLRTGQEVDYLIAKRTRKIKHSIPLVVSTYDLIIDLASSDASIQDSVRKMAKLKVPYNNKKRFLMQMWIAIKQYQEMIDAMFRVVDVPPQEQR